MRTEIHQGCYFLVKSSWRPATEILKIVFQNARISHKADNYYFYSEMTDNLSYRQTLTCSKGECVNRFIVKEASCSQIAVSKHIKGCEQEMCLQKICMKNKEKLLGDCGGKESEEILVLQLMQRRAVPKTYPENRLSLS